MAETIFFTDVGEGIHEGKLVKWLVKEGDAIKEDQPLCEIETDKAVVEIPSSKTGTILRLHGQVGQVMHVGEPLVTIGNQGEKVETPAAMEAQKTATPPAYSPLSTPVPAVSSTKPLIPPSSLPSPASTSFQPSPALSVPKATPAVRKLAQQLGVDLSRVSGTGPNGAILEKDVQNAKTNVSPAAVDSGPVSSQLVQPAALAQPTHPALIKATPSIRKLAFELGVDLSRVAGTGPSRHITEQDVRVAKSPAAATAVVPAASAPSSMAASSSHRIHVVSRPGGVEIRKPFSGLRKTISERLSWNTHVPLVTHVDEADVTELWKMREQEKKRAEEKGVKLTLLPFVVKAVCKALAEFPDFNAALDEEKNEVVLKKYYDVGIAVDTPAGLLVPVVKDADKKTVFDIAQEIQVLSTKARERSLKSDELSGSTFTITNIGSVGGLYATPVINPPEAAILGVMRMQTRPAFAPADTPNKPSGGKKAAKAVPKIEARQFLPLCLTFDHRLNDGAAAAAFVLEIKKHLENPESLLVGDI